jgi:3-phenylpropionate/trans-cinnamate dioxygenase ferredoxin reductase subunit
MKNIVILGAGQAGAGAALKLRELGFAGKITLLGDEAYAPYERPELSKAYALGKMAFSALTILTPADAADKGIDMVLGVGATAITRAARTARADLKALLDGTAARGTPAE